DRRKQEAEETFQAELTTKLNDFMQSAEEETVEHVETKTQEREKDSVEDDIRDRLRGFSRTIPAFLMAYGDIDNPATLATFDKIIPDESFRELTSISLDEFRYLRDVGNLFDAVTFDDSVKEFLNLRRNLADYFDETHTEDIFDYIPPQKTNQIFTPRETVDQMLAGLEEDSPGCFDDPNKTFIDLYMKSGLFAAEIVKRLYRSPRLKKLFPDKAKRLNHIFAEQVYGVAPTEIIYRIATNYILGFGIKIDKHNFRQTDTLAAVKEDKLNELLEELYG
ncbi:MAG: restriction endonuclease, partial [Quinella sp. 1Q5]|nr:restriction endonuclease [Quinella sp. 1Q5]